jgi:hypothetical protein
VKVPNLAKMYTAAIAKNEEQQYVAYNLDDCRFRGWEYQKVNAVVAL